MPKQRQGTPVSMLARQLKILDAFDAGTAFLTLSEIAERSGLPMTTTHRLVGELVEERMLERLPDRSYQLGLRLWELAARTPRAMGLREIAAPMVQLVQNQVRQHTQLGVEGGYDVVYLDRASRPDAVVNATIVGGRISLGASAIGHVLLADRPREFLAEVVASGIRRYTDSTPQTLADLVRVVQRVRQVGYAVAEGFVHPDARGMAAPICGPDGRVLAGLGVVVPSGGPVDMRIVELLRKAARGVSQQMRAAYIDPDHPHALPGAKFRVLINSSKSSMEYFADVQGDAADGVNSPEH
ncbi:MAG TPA: IclR family transcriptional regulator [Candidatus Yaniella excrementavium]|nr:IclR family transcriptional regulator [Candidatus Yaniella excrementavium]